MSIVKIINEKDDSSQTFKLSSYEIVDTKDYEINLTLYFSGKSISFRIAADDRWQNNISLIKTKLEKNLIDVLDSKQCCEISTFEAKIYLYFRFMTSFDEYENLDSLQFTGNIIK